METFCDTVCPQKVTVGPDGAGVCGNEKIMTVGMVITRIIATIIPIFAILDRGMFSSPFAKQLNINRNNHP
jgi:hypothetical protein